MDNGREQAKELRRKAHEIAHAASQERKRKAKLKYEARIRADRREKERAAAIVVAEREVCDACLEWFREHSDRSPTNRMLKAIDNLATLARPSGGDRG